MDNNIKVYFKRDNFHIYSRFLVGMGSCIFLFYFWFTQKDTSLIILAVVFLLFALLQFYKKGIEFDLPRRKFRIFYSFISIKYGSWQNFQQFEYVGVYKKIEHKESFVLNAPPQKFEGYQILLHDVNSTVYPIYFFENKEITFSKGIQISNYLNIPLLDATTHEYKWVEKV